NGGAASQINGYLEVAGRRAEVVIANGSGISVNGGGFINTSRAVLTTGTPNFAADGSLSGFNVSRGSISIAGAGLDASEVDQVDLLARAVQANAAIHAKNLNVVTGANSIEHDTLKTERIAGDGPAPGVSIDVAALGGMYANRIWLVGTENGVGVSLKGIAAAQAGDFIVTTEGKVILAGQTVASGNLSVSAREAIENDGTVYAQRDIDMTSAGAISNRGTVAAGRNATLAAGAALSNTNTLAAGGKASVSAATFDNRDGVLSADTVALRAMDIVNRGGSITQTGGAGVMTIDVAGTLDNAGGTIATNGGLEVRSGDLSNRGGTLAAQTTARLDVASLDNGAGGVIGARTVSIVGAGSLSNAGGTIQADNALSVAAHSVANDGGSIANSGTGATTVSAAGAITNTRNGLIGGNGDVTVDMQTLANVDGAQLVAGRDLTLNVAQLADNTNAMLSGARNVTLNGSNAALVNVGGSVHGNGTIALNTTSIDNSSGLIGNDSGSGGSLAIATKRLANQNGAIGSDGDLSIATGRLEGDGSIVAGHDGTVTIGGDYTLGAASLMQANHNLSLATAGNFTNQGTLVAVNALTVSAANVENQAGAVLNAAATAVDATGEIRNAGRVEGDTVTTHSASLSNTATIVGDTVTLNAGSIANMGTGAAIAAASAVNLYVRGDLSNTDGANIFSLGDINIAADATRDSNGWLANRANSVTNDQSTIEAMGSIEIATQTLTNSRAAPTVETVTTDVETIHETKRDKYMACTLTNANSHSSCTQDVWDNGYLNPLNRTFRDANVVSTASGPNAVDRVLVVNLNGQPQTIYYNALAANGDGTITVSYWDDYDPHLNYDPATEYAGDDQAHHHYQRVEVARDTTTTTRRDAVTGPQAQQAQLMAGGNLTMANVGAIDNRYSAIGAGASIQIGSAQAEGDVASGNYGGTLVNNIGRTLYEYQRKDVVSTYAWNEDISRDRGLVVQPSIILTPVAIGGLGGTIVANHAVQINATDVNNTNVVAASSATGATGGTLGANGVMSGIANARQSVLGPDGMPAFALPTSSLYALNAAPGASYLVVTDPRLTRYGSFVSSDYMLGQLGLDPSKTIKRLGDGVYEQQLIRNQITQLTGRVYLQGYTSNEDEYRALMSNAVHVAQEFSLVPGIALTAAQMDALTSDIVWLVNQTVTLADGSVQTVLAPVVYLAQVHANDLRPTGALIAADDIEIHATGNATNAGVIKGATQTVIGATNIVNRGGAIGSSAEDGTTVLSATNDVLNASGRITGNRVAVLAGHDIVNTTLADVVGVSSSAGNSSISQTLLGAQGMIASTGDMMVAAGHDLKVHGASISAGGDAVIAAGHDVTVDAVESRTSQSVSKNADNFMRAETTLNQTSSISAGGSLAMQSGNDMTFMGASVSAGGDLAVVAGGNLTATTVTNSAARQDVTRGDKTRSGEDRSYDEMAVGTSFSAGGNGTIAATGSDASAGNVRLVGSTLSTDKGAATIAATGNVDIKEAREEHDRYHTVDSKRGSFVSSTTTNEMQNTQANVAVGSTVSGDSVNITSGRNLTVAGSTIAGMNDVNLGAAGDVKITTSQDTQKSSSYYEQHTSGIGTSGLSLTIGNSSLDNTNSAASVTNNASTVGSVGGNLSIAAGNDLHVTGSDLIAAKNITGTGQNVTIDAATNTSQQSQTQKTHSSGLSIGLAGSMGDAINNAYSESQAASHSTGAGNDRAAALHAIAAAGDAGMAGVMAKDAVTKGGAPDIGIKVSVGSSSSRSDSSEHQTTNRGSNVAAGGTAAFVASGNDAPGSGNVTIAGSSIGANDVLLAGKNQVNVINTTDTDSTRSSNSSSSASVGVQWTTGGGFGISAAMSNAHGDANSDATIQNASHVNGANSVLVISGGDANVIGSQIAGKQISVDVGGNLNVTSIQDTTTSAAHQSSAGGGFAISQYGGASASVTAQKGHADGDYAGVNEQAGLYAGDGGFNVNVKGNTALTGAVVSSTADATKNSLTTGTLTFSDIQNQSHYSANSN
ncbi:MAG TPA: hemagglutinin repeat-containing protein, partial [Paraburkholderia sp.]